MKKKRVIFRAAEENTEKWHLIVKLPLLYLFDMSYDSVFIW